MPRIFKREGVEVVKRGKAATIRGKKFNLGHEEVRALIEKKAYELYCSRDCHAGNELSDWLKAEAEIRKECRSVG